MSLERPLFTQSGGNPKVGEVYEVYLGKKAHEWVIRLLRDENDAAAYLKDARGAGGSAKVWHCTVTITKEMEYVPEVKATVK